MVETAALLADELLPVRPLRQWVLSLPHALRILLATNPTALTQVLGVVYRTISRHLIDTAGLTRACGATGAVTLIQRLGSALNLNVHLHMPLLDGACLSHGANPPVFRSVAEPSANELQGHVEQIAARVGQVLDRRGLIGRDIENAWLAADAAGFAGACRDSGQGPEGADSGRRSGADRGFRGEGAGGSAGHSAGPTCQTRVAGGRLRPGSP